MEIRTLCDLFFHCVETYRKPDQLMFKSGGEWTPVSGDAFLAAVEELSMGLRSLGVDRGDKVAILSENRPEWPFADFATLCAGAIDVPIYATLLPEQILHILSDSEATAVVVSNTVQAKKVLEVRDRAPMLRHVILMDDEALAQTTTMESVRVRGREALSTDRLAVRKRAAAVGPDDVATLIYTSGTTGDPKGAMLTHANLVSNAVSAAGVFSVIGRNDVALSFLPLSHVFERTGHNFMLLVGVSVAYAESVEKVAENMVEVRPTLMLSVPRLYEKMYARVHERVAASSPLRRRLFRWAVDVGRAAFLQRQSGEVPSLFRRAAALVADLLVLKKIRARTGGRVKLLVSGGAPLAREIAEFLGAAGLNICEGYGLTETSPVITANRLGRIRPGTVGLPFPDVEVKIAEDGEILTRGPHVMKGYFKRPEATAEVIDADGWFRTGDVGFQDPDGFLVITDRKKDIIVTSGGKNIAPQPIENRLRTDPFIAEIVVIGNRRGYPAALIVPEYTALEPWAAAHGVTFIRREELVYHPEVLAFYEQHIAELTPDLAQFEKLKKIALIPVPFTLEAGELTPTLKVRRRVVEEHYKAIIDRLYETAA